MPNLKIKFSHEYPKIHSQTSAELLAVKILDADKLHPDLVDYDTKYVLLEKNNPFREFIYLPFGFYPLPKSGLLLQLIFVGDKGIPFCTLRRSTPQKQIYYYNSVGKMFDIGVQEKDD